MKLASLEDLFLDQLRDIYHAEGQLIKALPKMARAATEELRGAFEHHLDQTRRQSERLERIFEALGRKPKAKKCAAMEGLIEEGKELMREDAAAEVLDAGLIAAAQKVEHYEIAAYGTLAAWADRLGFPSAVNLLRETLAEEKEADQKLNALARGKVNAQAEHAPKAHAEPEPEPAGTGVS
jgi:ferritin-like metal-binding protein YciE